MASNPLTLRRTDRMSMQSAHACLRELVWPTTLLSVAWIIHETKLQEREDADEASSRCTLEVHTRAWRKLPLMADGSTRRYYGQRADASRVKEALANAATCIKVKVVQPEGKSPGSRNGSCTCCALTGCRGFLNSRWKFRARSARININVNININILKN